MTSPTTPGKAITDAAKRLAAQRETTRALSQTIADQRAQANQEPQESTALVGP